MKSLTGFLRTQYLKRKLDQKQVVIQSPVPGTGLTVSFSVHNWIEYHHRACDSYTGEPDLVEWLKSSLKPGDVLWDIGANVGAYSILAAKLCPEAKIFAFEPYIPTFSHLWENIALNQVSRQVFPICAGLLDTTAPNTLAIQNPLAGSAQHQVGESGGSFQQGILSIQGDDLTSLLHLPPPTLLKLDIDGLEVKALQGLSETITLPRLREMMIEIESGKSEKPVEDFARSAGFIRQPNPAAIANGGIVNARFSR